MTTVADIRRHCDEYLDAVERLRTAQTTVADRKALLEARDVFRAMAPEYVERLLRLVASDVVPA